MLYKHAETQFPNYFKLHPRPAASPATDKFPQTQEYASTSFYTKQEFRWQYY